MERKYGRVKTCVSPFYGVPGRPLARGWKDCLFFHDEAERVVVNSAEQNDCSAHGKAGGKHLISCSFGRLQVFRIGEPRSSHHASTITVRKQILPQAFAEGRGPHSPVGRFPCRNEIRRASRKDRSRHLVEQLLFALEVPVDGRGLNVELDTEAAKRQLLQPDLV